MTPNRFASRLNAIVLVAAIFALLFFLVPREAHAAPLAAAAPTVFPMYFVPFVGMPVQYFASGLPGATPSAGTIAAVRSSNEVNLCVIDDVGNTWGKTAVRLLQPEEPAPVVGGYCRPVDLIAAFRTIKYSAAPNIVPGTPEDAHLPSYPPTPAPEPEPVAPPVVADLVPPLPPAPAPAIAELAKSDVDLA